MTLYPIIIHLIKNTEVNMIVIKMLYLYVTKIFYKQHEEEIWETLCLIAGYAVFVMARMILSKIL